MWQIRKKLNAVDTKTYFVLILKNKIKKVFENLFISCFGSSDGFSELFCVLVYRSRMFCLFPFQALTLRNICFSLFIVISTFSPISFTDLTSFDLGLLWLAGSHQLLQYGGY